MIATLNDGDSQLIRRVVNLVLKLEVAMYGQCKHRIISPVPKEEGNFRLDKARPIVLLNVLQKSFLGYYNGADDRRLGNQYS